jgi:diguanylate cyclase (GGDEF)-like protein/PAS domain S-box-containing protein
VSELLQLSIAALASLLVPVAALWMSRLLTRRHRADERAESERRAQLLELQQAHVRLREHDARYRAAVETSTDGFMVTDLKGRLLDVNEAYARRSGYTREELLGMRIAQLGVSMTPQEMDALGKRVMERGGEIFEGTHRSKDGALWPVEVSLTYVPHDGGQFMSFVRDISERKQSERALRESEWRFRTIFEHAAVGVALVESRTGRMVRVNQKYCDILGCTAEDALARTERDITPADDLPADEQAMARLLAGEIPSYVLEKRYQRKDGTIVWVRLTVSAMWAPGEKAGFHIAVAEDITERKRVDGALRQSDRRLRQAVRVSDIGIFDHDHAADTVYWSPELRRIYGLAPDETVTLQGFLAQLHADDKLRIAEAVRRAHDPAGDGLFDVEHRIVRRDGERRWVATRSQTTFEGQAEARRPVRTVGAVIDITERKRTEEELRRARDSIEVANRELQRLLEREQVVARTDVLTGLPNRILFQDRLQQAIASAARDPGRRVAVLLMDLDNFKEINDTLGHPAGDQVLVQIAQRLAGVVRDEDTITRLGGDEFAVLLPAISVPPQTVQQVAHKLLAALTPPVFYQDRELHVSASIGISIYPDDGDNAATLVARADVAMYASKGRRAGSLFYDSAMDSGVDARLQRSNELRHALERNELFLEFQPKVDLASGLVTGAEALVRWRHPSAGRIEPIEFIPLAERSGLIHALTDWVIEHALARCREWRVHGYDLHVAVNISGRTLPDPGFADRVLQALAASGLPAPGLELEITENTLMADIEHAGQLLDRLYARGVRISIDDFGTGYSSLTYLKRLPLHALKIDQSFVRDMARDGSDAAIVRSIIDLAHNLGRSAVAEGVEDPRSLELLRRYGCDSAQGYFLCRPRSDEDFQSWLTARDRH